MKDERIYKIDGLGDLPSVTTVLGQIDKSGPLMGWAVKVTIEYLQDHPEELKLDPKETFKRAKSWHKELKQTAADIGSAVHNCIEVYLKGQPIDGLIEFEPRIEKPFEAFIEWQKGRKFELVKSEHTIFSKAFKYAGTLDCVARIDNKLTLIDFKSSKGIYDDMVYQVAAYFKAYEEMTGEKIEASGILRLDKETGEPEWREITMGEVEYGFNMFKCFLGAWWFKKQRKEVNDGL